MQISVIIPTYNGRLLLTESLPFLFGELHKITSSEVIIVDNCSIDGTAQFLKEQYPEVKYIKLPKNQGFTGAVNAGVDSSQAEYLLILNNDCLIARGCLRQMLKTLENGSTVATQPVIKNFRGQIESIGYKVDLKNAKAHVLTKPDPELWQNQPDLFEQGYMYGLSGTCLLIKSRVLRAVGGFDSSFHSYLEDVDLCIRLAKQGYHFLPTFTAECIHHHRATSQKMGSYKERHDLTNWIRIIIKDYPSWFVLKYFPSLVIERARNLSGLMKKALF